MSLEPTDEQLKRMVGVSMEGTSWTPPWPAKVVDGEVVEGPWEETALKASYRRMFAYVRDVVLEEAKEACSRFMDEQNAEATKPHQDKLMATYAECHANGAANCVAILHAMKGPKP